MIWYNSRWNRTTTTYYIAECESSGGLSDDNYN